MRFYLVILLFLFSCEEPKDCAGHANGDAFIDDCGMCMEDYVSTILEYEDWIILWEDHFLDETINPDNWNLEYWEPGRYNDELQAYTPRPENAYIEDGNLIIQALREDYTYIDYNTGLEIHTSLPTSPSIDTFTSNVPSVAGIVAPLNEKPSTVLADV